jgi:NAD(P)-dependent dehydrogenase (short-subunit alcohol dehydrogenase family)
VVGYRTEEKAKKNLEGLKVELEYLDLQDQASILIFAEKFNASGRPLHILVNNAAIAASPLVRDSRGYESQFATNVLGHFVLTAKLWPALVKARGARVVNVSSRGHSFSPVVFEDWNFERREYSPWTGYGQSKTGNILFTVALDAKGKGVGVRSFALHPGAILMTESGRFQDPEVQVAEQKSCGVRDEAGNINLDPLRQVKTVEQGAATQVWAATRLVSKSKRGLYLESSNIAPLSKDIVSVSWSGQQVRNGSAVWRSMPWTRRRRRSCGRYARN